MPYVLQSLFLLLGPTLLAASIYMVLGRLIRLLNADNYSIIRTTWLTKVFVLGDVISFLAQSGGKLLMTWPLQFLLPTCKCPILILSQQVVVC